MCVTAMIGKKTQIITVKSQPKNTKKQVHNELQAAGGQMSLSTIKQVLYQRELRDCLARKMPFLQTWQPKA